MQQDDAAARNRLGSGILSDDDEEEVPQDKVCSFLQILGAWACLELVSIWAQAKVRFEA